MTLIENQLLINRFPPWFRSKLFKGSHLSDLPVVPFLYLSTGCFSVAVIKYHDQKQLKEESLLWLTVPEGVHNLGTAQQGRQSRKLAHHIP